MSESVCNCRLLIYLSELLLHCVDGGNEMFAFVSTVLCEFKLGNQCRLAGLWVLKSQGRLHVTIGGW